MRNMRLPCLSALALLFFAVTPLMAGTVYKCVNAGGHVSYQDTPCPHGQRQQRLHLSNAQVPSPPATPATSVASSPAPESKQEPPPRARPPPPVLYRCIRATDGSAYLSRDGHPRTYLAPMGMLGAIRQPLADVHGSAQGAGVGMSAPELANKPTPGLIGSYYTPVRDVCRLLPPHAACIALRDQYETNEDAIHKAFKSDRAPLLQKRRQLHAQMVGCW